MVGRENINKIPGPGSRKIKTVSANVKTSTAFYMKVIIMAPGIYVIQGVLILLCIAI